MSAKDNVIDITSYRQSKQAQEPNAKAKSARASVLNMTERRQEILMRERRQVKRTILTEFVGAFAVIPQQGLLKVSLYDISDQGLAFDIEAPRGALTVGETVAFRVYLNRKTYFPFFVTVQNIRAITEEAVYRHGAFFEKETVNAKALHHFIRFIETVSASLHGDEGDIMVSGIND